MLKKISTYCALAFLSVFLLVGCLDKKNKEKEEVSEHGSKKEASAIGTEAVDKQLVYAEKQLSLLLAKAEEVGAIPRTVADGEIHWIGNVPDWTEGFFPGTCWYLYETTKDEKWKIAAEKWQATFEDHKNLTTTHDLGFMIGCSYGNAYRLTGDEAFKEVLVTSADSLITRFNPNVGAIKSWNIDKGWQSKRGWKYPVIIDNMMNLELLFNASKFTGDSKYKEVAITHANTTLKNHFRKDFSSFHVIDYDPETGAVRNGETAQGFAHESAWARGQAWGLYGFTVCYRFTKDPVYLKQAEHIAKFIIENNRIPNDGIPYWDYDAANIPNEPRDVSAAAIAVSALIELDTYTAHSYKPYINKIFESLASNDYLAKIGENNLFLLKHSVGSIPHNAEIDVPLNYADYYYLEALVRSKTMLNTSH